MKKLIILHLSMYETYNLVLKNEKFPRKQYVDFVILLIYVLLNGDVSLSKRTDSIFVEKTLDNNVVVKKELLDKTLYYMDATLSFDDQNNVTSFLQGFYYQQTLSLLYILLQGKNIRFKPVFDNVVFYETVYRSICEKLKLEEDSEFLFYLHHLRKKSKILTTKLFSIVGDKNILEVKLYSKYDDFEKEYCNKYRFIITKSNDTTYPVGSYVFGTIQLNQTSVILYRNPECTLLI